ncbi:transposase-like protein, partial [Staphylococcus saprophyticus]
MHEHKEIQYHLKWYSAYAFIKRLIKQFGKPQKVITDQAPSTKVAMAKVIKAFKL